MHKQLYYSSLCVWHNSWLLCFKLAIMTRQEEVIQKTIKEAERVNDDFIFIRDTHTIRRIKMDEILFVEAMGDYVKLYTSEKLYAIHNKLKVVEDRLPINKFVRIHRSYIVALGKIDTLKDGAVIIGDRFLPVADSYRKILNIRMQVI